MFGFKLEITFSEVPKKYQIQTYMLCRIFKTVFCLGSYTNHYQLLWLVTFTEARPISRPVTLNSIHKKHNNPSDKRSPFANCKVAIFLYFVMKEIPPITRITNSKTLV